MPEYVRQGVLESAGMAIQREWRRLQEISLENFGRLSFSTPCPEETPRALGGISGSDHRAFDVRHAPQSAAKSGPQKVRVGPMHMSRPCQDRAGPKLHRNVARGLLFSQA